MTHGANAPVIVEYVNGDKKILFQDLLSEKQAHDKIKVVIHDGTTEVYHFLTAANFLVYCNLVVNESRLEDDDDLSYFEKKGSPNKSSEGFTARTATFSLDSRFSDYRINVELISGIGVQTPASIEMANPLNTQVINIPLLEFQAMCFRITMYAQAKMTASMLKVIPNVK